jgi:hypothetical protein
MRRAVASPGCGRAAPSTPSPGWPSARRVLARARAGSPPGPVPDTIHRGFLTRSRAREREWQIVVQSGPNRGGSSRWARKASTLPPLPLVSAKIDAGALAGATVVFIGIPAGTAGSCVIHVPTVNGIGVGSVIRF